MEELLACWPAGGAGLAGQLMRAAAGLHPGRQGAQARQASKDRAEGLGVRGLLH